MQRLTDGGRDEGDGAYADTRTTRRTAQHAQTISDVQARFMHDVDPDGVERDVGADAAGLNGNEAQASGQLRLGVRVLRWLEREKNRAPFSSASEGCKEV